MQFNVSYTPPAFIRLLRRERIAPLLQKQRTRAVAVPSVGTKFPLPVMDAPHRLDVFRRPSPISLDREVTELNSLLPPARIRQAAQTIFFVTKRSGRSGDSWLNRMPLAANRP